MPLNFGSRLQRFALRPPERDAFLNILEGSVRSGKTWALHPKILYGCQYKVTGWRLLTGASKLTIYENVLHDLIDLVGASEFQYNRQTGQLRLCGADWLVMGAKDEGSEKYLRGKTVGYAVADELTLMPRDFFEMLLTRLSPKGARFYASTNPDSPMHWLKTDYLDREDRRRSGQLFSLHTTMDDNPNLTADYIAQQKTLHTGPFYDRYILGLWVMAEGSIYRDAWSDELIFIDATRPIGLLGQGGYVDRWIAVDVGVDHPQVYLEFYDDGRDIWVNREYYWDSRKQARQKTDSQYADDLMEFMGPSTACQVIVPPEAASFRAELVGRGIWVTDANNEVNEGIQTVSGLMATKHLRIHQNCKELRRTVPSYIWDQKAAKRGKEQPLKQDDDAVDALRYGCHGKIPLWRFGG